MLIPLAIIFSCLAVAIFCTILGDGSDRKWLAHAALFAVYGVCVGIVALLLVYFLSLGQGVAVAIAVPLGLPALWMAAKMAEA